MINYETIDVLKLDTDNTVLRSHAMPELVHLEDPAVMVMVDYGLTPAVTLKENASIHDAETEMQFHGTHFMLVTDENEQIKGVITSEDILGEKLIKVIQQLRISHNEVIIKQLMTAIDTIPAFNINSIEQARVGNVVKTLHQLDSHYALVVETEDGDTKKIRGHFTTAQISKQLHKNVRKRIHDIDSVSDLTDWQKK